MTSKIVGLGKMDEETRYKTIDLPFYRSEIAPLLPKEILDFHAHVWRVQDWKEVPWEKGRTGAKYMVTDETYTMESLLEDGRRMFPGKRFSAVCFGMATPAADLEKTNAYTTTAAHIRGMFPLHVTGKGTLDKEELKRQMIENGFFGYKVLLNWHGNDYGRIRVQDMIGSEEMKLADSMKLVVLLHVPRNGRLADPVIQRGVRELSTRYPNVSIVLAHCGRAYLPSEMKAAYPSIVDLKNVYLDTSMVMDPTVLQMLFENIESSRILFGTDLPVARMRGRRVYVMDHWVDLVLSGPPESAYRAHADNIRATFMVYEIILAIQRGGEMAGLGAERIRDVFGANGMRLLDRVRPAAQQACSKGK